MTATYKNDFERADEVRQFKGHGHLDLLKFDDGGKAIGRGIFEPGWKWSRDIKPIVGTETCQVEHFGYCIAGEMTVKMDNGDEFTIKGGDAFHIPPGHDAWVDGKENCVLLDVSGFGQYATKKTS